MSSGFVSNVFLYSFFFINTWCYIYYLVLPECVYDSGTWSECDTSETPVRIRTQKLLSGDAGCKKEKVTTKSCQKKNGSGTAAFFTFKKHCLLGNLISNILKVAGYTVCFA